MQITEVELQLMDEEARTYTHNLRKSFEWRDTFKPNPELPFVRAAKSAFNFSGYLEAFTAGETKGGLELRAARRSHVALTAISIQATQDDKAKLSLLFQKVLDQFIRLGLAPKGTTVRSGMREQMKVLTDPLADLDKPLLLVAEWKVDDLWDPVPKS